MLGFPQDGPFDAQPVRIRGDQRLRSPDIYGNGTVTRHVFSLRGLIRPGNSGGPVVSTGGRVLGVVFAASVSDQQHRLRADRRPGPPAAARARVEAGVERNCASDAGSPSSGNCACQGCPKDARSVSLRPAQLLRLSRVLFSLACSIARSGALTFLIIRTPMNPSRPASSR